MSAVREALLRGMAERHVGGAEGAMRDCIERAGARRRDASTSDDTNGLSAPTSGCTMPLAMQWPPPSPSASYSVARKGRPQQLPDLTGIANNWAEAPLLPPPLLPTTVPPLCRQCAWERTAPSSSVSSTKTSPASSSPRICSAIKRMMHTPPHASYTTALKGCGKDIGDSGAGGGGGGVQSLDASHLRWRLELSSTRCVTRASRETTLARRSSTSLGAIFLIVEGEWSVSLEVCLPGVKLLRLFSTRNPIRERAGPGKRDLAR